MNYAGNGIVQTRQITFSDFPIDIIQEPAPVQKPAKKPRKPKVESVSPTEEMLEACGPCFFYGGCDVHPNHNLPQCKNDEAIKWAENCAFNPSENCKECEARPQCKKHTEKEYSCFNCKTCGHHKARKTFHETCPRLGELLFMKGTKSATVLMDETAGRHPCMFWISKEADRFGPCPEKNSMGTCMHGAYSCPHKTREARAAVGCTYPIQPPHYAGDSPLLKYPPKKARSLT